MRKPEEDPLNIAINKFVEGKAKGLSADEIEKTLSEDEMNAIQSNAIKVSKKVLIAYLDSMEDVREALLVNLDDELLLKHINALLNVLNIAKDTLCNRQKKK